MPPSDRSQDIRDRTFAYACFVAKLALALPPRPGVRSIADQLLRSATSVGANLEEAKAASSPRDFIRFIEISLREAREATYWLRICAALELGDVSSLRQAAGEGDQIARILAAIAISKKARMKASVTVFALCISNFALHAS